METRRILLDGLPTAVDREGDELVAPDGRRMPLDEPPHLPPVHPTKIICVHLNYESRRAEFGATLGPAPTYFHKPVSSLNAHGGDVVRPPRCRFLIAPRLETCRPNTARRWDISQLTRNRWIT